MRLSATIVAMFVLAALFGWAIPLVRLFDIFQTLVVSLSIMVAAILVRLNRGMPTLDWKSLNVLDRTRLTKKIVDITKEYLIIISIDVIFICFIISLTAIGKNDVASFWPNYLQITISSIFGASIVLCLSRMAYIVWRDYDIVKLQKKLIDDSGNKDFSELEMKSAEGKLADIRSAGLRKLGAAEIKPWT